MSDASVIAVIGGVLLLLPAAFIARMPSEVRRARIDLIRADLGLRRARASHAGLIRAADRNLRNVERRHSDELAELDRRIVALEDPRGAHLDSFGPVSLHALRIVTPAGEVPLDGVTATVDSAGALSERKRTTLTRLAVGGALLGPLGAVLALGFPKRRRVDTRELYLLIEAGGASCLLQIEPDDGARVRSFATQVNGSAMAVAERRVATARELEMARARLAEVREDHSALDAARQRLADVHADPEALAAIARAEQERAAASARLALAEQVDR